ncbi:unnamed protein product, partial [Ixodes persulcatus]
CGAGRDIDPEPYARPAGPASGPRPHRGSTGRLDLEGGSEPCRGPSPSLVVLEVSRFHGVLKKHGESLISSHRGAQ